MKIVNVILNKFYRVQVLVVAILLGSLLAGILAYLFLLLGVVSNVAERGELEQGLPTLVSEVSELEFQYLALKNGLDQELVTEKGLVMVEDVDYIHARAVGQAD